MKKANSNSIVLQGSILAIASLFVRLIGFFYRIPLVRILGEEGMGYYSSAFEIYSFILIISAYAFPAALSKIIASKVALGKHSEAHYIFKSALLLGGIIGIITSSILLFKSESIANIIIGNAGSAYALKALAPALLFFSIMAVFRGYFQGMNTMIPTAVSQIIEQIFNAIFSLLMAYLFLKQGVAYGAAGGTLGTGIGAFFGLIFLIILYILARPIFKKRFIYDKVSEVEGRLSNAWKLILMTSMPMLIGSTAYNLSGLIDTAFFQRALVFHGMEISEAASQYGLLTAKYRLILMLPIAVATALGTASIPSITRSLVKKEFSLIREKAKTSIQMVIIISVPAACGLGFLAKPILRMLFGETNLGISAELMSLGAISIVFFSVSAISIAILQGLGKLKIPLYHSIMAVGVKISLTIVLLFIFDFGLKGAVINSIIFSLLVAILNYSSVRREIRLNLNPANIFGYPIFSGISMGLVIRLVHMGMVSATNSNTLSTLVAILVGIVFYIVTMIFMGGLTEEMILALPKGNSMVKTLKKVKLM